MADEIQILAQNALKSPALKNAILLRRLLQLLAGKRGLSVPAIVIWDEVFIEDENPDPDWQRVREVASRARFALKEIAEASGADRFLDMPDANEADGHGDTGYRLVVREKKKAGATAAFWRVHTRSDNVKLVYPEPVFYYDIVELAYLRYLDTNPRTVSVEEAISELERRHGSELKEVYKEPLRERLRPSRVYVGIGDIQAMDALAEWFMRRSILPIKREASDRVSSLQGVSPILIGSERTNRFIETFLNAEEGSRFGFRQDPARLAFVTIKNPNKEEQCEFPGFIVEEKDGLLTVGQNATMSQVRDRLVIVTRMQMPGGKGWVTTISSDATLAVREVALALVDDVLLENILEQAKMDTGDLPEAFEMLFSVRIAPAGIEHAASVPKLRCVRKY